MSRCEIDIVYWNVNEKIVIDKMWNIHLVMWLDEMKDETTCQDAKRTWYIAMLIVACCYKHEVIHMNGMINLVSCAMLSFILNFKFLSVYVRLVHVVILLLFRLLSGEIDHGTFYFLDTSKCDRSRSVIGTYWKTSCDIYQANQHHLNSILNHINSVTFLLQTYD